MAGVLNLVYSVVIVAVAAIGVLGVTLVTENPHDTAGGYGSQLTAIATALFVVATAWTLIG